MENMETVKITIKIIRSVLRFIMGRHIKSISDHNSVVAAMFNVTQNQIVDRTTLIVQKENPANVKFYFFIRSSNGLSPQINALLSFSLISLSVITIPSKSVGVASIISVISSRRAKIFNLAAWGFSSSVGGFLANIGFVR